MVLIHYFNPENDLALAANVANYTPPKAAQWLHDAGSVLPLWYGNDGDKVMCSGVNAMWYDDMRAAFGIGVDVFDHNTDDPDIKAAPWGWSLAARRDFADEGFACDQLPKDEQLIAMRNLSHRRTALLISDMLRARLPFAIGGEGIEATDLDQVRRAMDMWGNCYVKAPWSSSGRGVASIEQIGQMRWLKMAEDSIRRQGSVIVERGCDKAVDFALLYRCDKGKCKFVGTSVFITDANGGYVGNLLASEEMRRRRLAQYCDMAQIDAIAKALTEIIDVEIAPYYDGILGVDMLVGKDGLINPAVEINLRKTMGYVAHRLSERFLAEGCEGLFSVRPGTLSDITDMGTLSFAANRLSGGTLYLTPPNGHFAFVVKV